MSTSWSRFRLGRRSGLLASALTALTLLAGAASASASQLLYYGGPVVHSANLVLVKWGADVRASYANSTSGDPGFLSYLASQSGSTSDIGGVLAQYMDSSSQNSQNRVAFAGTIQVSPTVGAAPQPTASVQDGDVQAELARDINAGTLPAP